MTRIPPRVFRARFPARALFAVALLFATIRCGEVPTKPMAPSAGPSLRVVGALTITPTPDTLLVGQTAILTAQSGGSPVTKLATWTSSDTSIARVVSTGVATAQVTARAAGAVTITAVSQSKSGTGRVVVNPVPVRSVTVAPTVSSLERGDSVQFTATPRDSVGNALGGRAVSWTVADTIVGRVSATGKASAVARGTTQVRATVEGVLGTASLTVRVPQLTVSTLATADSVNIGDTLVVRYSTQNLWDTPNADSVLVRVGLRDASGTMQLALRRALPRINGGATTVDTVRFFVGTAISAGNYSVVAYADCADSAGVPNAARLTSCLATPATAGTLREGDETDNSRSAAVVVRGADLIAGTVTGPDSSFTRTTVPVSVSVSNSGSATTTGFDVVAGLYDVTGSTVVAAVVTTTPVLGSRATRSVALSLGLPPDFVAGHAYEIRAFVDCRNTGATPIARLQACITTPATAGEIGESSETNNSASRTTIVASNVARLDAQPDSMTFTAIGDSLTLSANAFDRANAVVTGATIAWTSLDPSIASN